jgi:hypothetical protein
MSATQETVQQRLTTFLAGIEDEAAREDLFNRFFLLNPLEFCQFLHSLPDVADSVKSALLREKVMQPAACKGIDLAPVVDRAMAQMWKRIGVEV